MENNVFEQYYEYVGAVVTEEEKLRKSFESFLKHPEIYGGFFVVRWKENDTMYNNTTLSEFMPISLWAASVP